MIAKFITVELDDGTKLAYSNITGIQYFGNSLYITYEKDSQYINRRVFNKEIKKVIIERGET